MFINYYNFVCKFFKDLREPHKWFPEARILKRKIIYHYGPTNSGKTYNALLNLKTAEKGIYCSPLRLLAWEVNSIIFSINKRNYKNYKIQEKLNETGIPCSLLTGQEKKIVPDAKIISCTVECTNLHETYDIALIVIFFFSPTKILSKG